MSKNKNKGNNHNYGEMTGAFITGALVAAVAGGYYLFGSKNSKQNRKKVEAWVVKAKGDVFDDVTEKYKKLKDVSEDKVENLRKELKMHWKNIEKDVQEGQKKGKKKLNSTRKKLAKKIDPKK